LFGLAHSQTAGLRENAFNQDLFFKVSISKGPAQTGGDFPVLQNTYTQDEAAQRYCGPSMGGERTFCQEWLYELAVGARPAGRPDCPRLLRFGNACVKSA
jgi:hypothetical protein